MKLGSVGAVSHTGDLRCCEAGAEGQGGAVGGFVGVHLCVCVCWERHCSLSVLVSVCGFVSTGLDWLNPQAETAAAASIKLRWKVPYSESAGL